MPNQNTSLPNSCLITNIYGVYGTWRLSNGHVTIALNMCAKLGNPPTSLEIPFEAEIETEEIETMLPALEKNLGTLAA